MFDIGFWEIALIAVVALLVVGPEEFPALVRTIGATLGKIRRFVQDAKQELDREVLQAEELKRLMEQEAKIAELHEVVEDLNTTIPVDPAPPAVTKEQGKSGAEGKTDGEGDREAPAGGTRGGAGQEARREQDIGQDHGASKKEISS